MASQGGSRHAPTHITVALVAGGALAVATVGVLASGILIIPIEKISGRLRGRGPGTG